MPAADVLPSPAAAPAATPVDAPPDPVATREAAQQTFLRLLDEKRYDEATTLAVQVIDLTRRMHGDGSREMAVPLANLGTAQMQAGDLAGAQASYLAAVAAVERHEGIASPQLANPLLGLGETCLRAGLYPQAIEAFQRALHVNHTAAGFYNLEQIQVLDGLSEAYLGLDKLDEANAQQRVQVTIQKRHAPGDSRATTQALQKLGRWYSRTGQYEPARIAFQDARRVIRTSGGDYDPRMVEVMLSEALTYTSEGAVPEAATVLRRALDLVNAQPKPDRAQRAEVLVALADLYTVTRQPRAARQRYVEAWQELSTDDALLPVRDRYFAQPLRIAGPRLPEVVDEGGRARSTAALGQASYDQGIVVAALTVTAQGRASGSRIIEATPPGLLDRQMLRVLDAAAFRPAMIDGEPADSPDVQFRHEFRYPHAAEPRREEPLPEAAEAAGHRDGPIAYPEARERATGPDASP